MCPGFTADCLETLEEIDQEVRAAFLAAGGREFRPIPCLNDSHPWIDALAQIALLRHLQGWPTALTISQKRARAAAPAMRGSSTIATITSSSTDTGRCRNTPQWPSPMDSAFAHRLGQRPGIMPTTTGAVGSRSAASARPAGRSHRAGGSKADWRMPYTPTVAKIRMPA